MSEAVKDAPEAALSYMPRLDGLRALAIAGVLVHHFAPNKYLRGLELGPAGVTLFFVLSGYLITRVLMKIRGDGLAAAAAEFYWRRFLRLSPPLYLAILVTSLADVSMMRETWWINATYLTNFQLAFTGSWESDGAFHFWSLCTEEQFYFLWFFVIVALPQKHLLPAIWLSIATTLIFRAVFMAAGLPYMTFYFLLCNLAPLAMGALLAVARDSEELGWFDGLTRDRGSLSCTGAAALGISIFILSTKSSAALVVYPFVLASFSLCLVAVASTQEKDRLFDWLAWSPLRYLGKISYGIYVYHLFVRPLALTMPGMAWLAATTWSSFVFLVAASICLAHLSWAFFESPILRLKQYWPRALRSARA